MEEEGSAALTGAQSSTLLSSGLFYAGGKRRSVSEDIFFTPSSLALLSCGFVKMPLEDSYTHV